MSEYYLMLLNRNHKLLIEPYQVHDVFDHKQDHDIYVHIHIDYVEEKPRRIIKI